MLSAALVFVPGSAAMVAATEHDDPDAIALRDGLASFVLSLAKVGTVDELVDQVPLTPADLPAYLGLDTTMALLAADIVASGGVTFDELENALADGFELPSMLNDLDNLTGSITGTLDRSTTPHTIALSLNLSRSDGVPIAIGTDLLGLSGDGPVLTAGFTATATLEFDPAALNGPDPLSALQLRVSGPNAPAMSFAADVAADWNSPNDPLAANVGILAVDVTGTAGATFNLAAQLSSAVGDQTIARGTWESTSGVDLFTAGTVNATANADLELTSSMSGVQGVTGTVGLNWSRAAGPADWADALEIELGSLGDFRNIVVEEVLAAISQLAVSLRAVQVSGAADIDLPFILGRLQNLAGFHERILDWLTDLDLATVPPAGQDGPIVLLEELNRQLLEDKGLLDVESILQNLADFLGLDSLEPAYDPATKQLTFDLEYKKKSDPREVNLDFSGQLESSGVRNLQATSDASATATPEVTADLGLALSLEFDPERTKNNPDLEALLTVADRLALRTGATSLSLDVPIDADIELAGSIGFVGIDVTASKKPFVTTAAGADHMLSVTFDGGSDGLLSLEELVNNLNTGTSPVNADIAVQVVPTALTIAAKVGPATSSGTLHIAWSDVTDPGSLQIDPSGLGDLLAFDFDHDNPLALLSFILQTLDGLIAQVEASVRGAGALELPVIGIDLMSFLSELKVIRERVQALANDPAATIQGLADQLNGMILDALGGSSNSFSAQTTSVVNPDADLVSLDIDTSTGAPAVIVKIDLSVCSAPDKDPSCIITRPVSVPFQLDLATVTGQFGELVGLHSGGQLDIDYLAKLGIHAGVQLPAGGVGVPQPFLLESTGAVVELDVASEDLTLDVNLGPLSLKAGKASDKGSAKLSGKATLSSGGTGRVPLGQITDWAQDLDFDITGKDKVTCPIPAADPNDPPGATEEADACVRLPLYLNDTHLSDIRLAVLDIGGPFTPANWKFTIPDAGDLLAALASELLSFKMLVEGLKYLIDLIGRSLDGASNSVKVPVVGDVLDGGAKIAEQLNAFLDKVTPVLENPGGTVEAIQNNIENAINDALNDLELDAGAGVIVVLKCGGNPCGNNITSDLIDDIEINLSIGQNKSHELPGFDVGIPGLRLGVSEEDTALEAGVEWSLDVTFGVNRTDGFYVQTGGPNDRELSVGTSVTLPNEIYGDLALLFIKLTKIDGNKHDGEMGANPDKDLSLTAYGDLKGGSGGKLSLHKLISGTDTANLELGTNVTADLRYTLKTIPSLPSLNLPDDELLPSLTTDLLLKWSWEANTTTGFGSLDAPEVLGFRDVKLDLGEFIENFLGPILKEVRRFTAPFQPVIDVVNAPIPGVSDLSEMLTGQQISMLTLFEAASGADLTMLRRILGIVQLVSAIADAGATGQIPIGNFDLNKSLALDRPVAASEIAALVQQPLNKEFLNTVVDQAGGIFSADALAAGAADPGASTAFTKSRQGGGFSFPAFENPSQLFELLVGGDPTLVLWESGTLQAGFGTSYTFPPIFIGPVPISIVLSMAASISGQIGIGYDTYGIRRAVEAFMDGPGPSVGDTVSLLFQGVFLNDWNAQKVDVPEIVLSAEFAAGAAVSLGIVAAGLELGLRSTIDMNLRDESGTGKVRIDQIIANFFTPICLFEVGGQIDIFMRAFLKFNFLLFSKTFNFTIFEITLLRLNDILKGVCEPKPPNLADVVDGDNGKVLVVNVGDRGGNRGVLPGKEDESVVVRPLNEDNSAFSVAAFGEYEEYGVPGGVEETPITGVSFQGRTIKVVADGGPDKDSITMAAGTKKALDGDPNDGKQIDQTGIDNTAIPFKAAVLVCGGSDEDVITGGEGNDILVGDGKCPVTTSGGNISLSGLDTTDLGDSDGADRIYGVGGANLMYGLGGADQLYGGFDGGDTMIGGSGDDVLRADGDNGSVLIGGSRIDPVSAPTGVSQPGDDQLFGADAADVLIGDNGHVSGGTVYVDLSAGGDDILEGGAGNDRLYGGPARDIMYGGTGNDYLDGGNGGDAVVGGLAADPNAPPSDDPGFNVVVGGRGNDHLIAHHAEVQRDNDGNIVGVIPAGSASNAALAVGGSLYNTTSPGSDGVWGGDGGDLLVGDDVQPVNASHRPAQSASLVTYPSGLTSSAFAALRGRDADGLPTGVDTLDDDGGHDRLFGGGGNDSGFGGPGNDIVVGGRPAARAATGSDLLVGGRGHDVLIGDNGRDDRTTSQVSANATPKVTLLAGPVPATTTVNRLIGGSVDDLTNPGNDWLYAGQYGDVMIGDNGKITANLTADVYLTHGGNDHVFGSQGEDRGFGGPGQDVVRGGPANDILEGGPHDDEVYGDSGDDILLGGTSRPGIPSGDDDLFGGFGVDALAGDNARIVHVTADGLHGTNYAVELFDLPLAGGSAPAGTAGKDVLSGGGATDLLYGQNGTDVLFGDEGNDFLQGGPDDDELYGGAGSDSLAGGNGLHVEYQDTWPLLPAVTNVHRVPVPNAGVAFGFADLVGHADGADLVVGGTGPDGLAGDNAVVEQTGFGQFDVRLLDVEYAGELPPPTGASGSDVLIGGSIGDVANPGNDLGFGQGKADLLIGDNAAELSDARLYAPLLHASDGNDHLEGNAGDDTVFGNGGADRLLGGSSDVAIADAATRGVVAGNDVLSGGPGDDYALGDNGRIEKPAPWWSTGVGGESVTLFDEKIDGAALPHPATAGNDLLLGGSLRGEGDGLLGDQTEADSPGHDLLHAQARDDLLFGDDVTVDVSDWTGGWHAIRPDVTLPIAQWQIATLDWVVEGAEAAAGGDDLMLGGPDDDIAFGGPAQDDILGGSWQAGRHDGRDLIDGGPSHDVVAGDNATILRPFEDGTFTCQTYRHRYGDVAAWQTASGGDVGFDCAVGTPDADPDNGVYTRVVRAAEMLDQEPGVTSGSDLVWGNYGDDDITGQFDDTAEFTAGTWAGLPAWRLVEWCRLDAHLAALIGADALDVAKLSEGDTMADYLAYYGFDLGDVAFGGDVLCGAAGEDAVLGDQGVVANIVEDGGREAVIAPQQPFMEALIFAEGTLTRQVSLSQRTTGGNDVVLGGDDGDWLHGGAGNDLMNGNFGDDRVFGDDNDDALWGGAGYDHLYGGNHADDLDVRPRLSKPASGPGNPNRPPVHPGDPAERFLIAVEGDGYDGRDHLYGGWHRDVMQADEGGNGPVEGDRAIDWGGVYNLWYNCPATYGAWIDIRSPYPGLQQYLINQAAGDGALDPGTAGSSGFDELALVYQADIRHNTNPPHPETPGHFTCGAADGT